MKFALLAGIASAASIDASNMFALENFAKKDIVAALLANANNRNIMEVSDASNGVTFKQCDDDKGSFQMDQSATVAVPEPLVKGSDVKLHLEGLLTDKIHVENIHIHVDWNSSPLYDEDHKDGTDYDSNIVEEISWAVPSYAPDGAYHVVLTGYDTDKKTKVMCVTADFTF